MFNALRLAPTILIATNFRVNFTVDFQNRDLDLMKSLHFTWRGLERLVVDLGAAYRFGFHHDPTR